MGAHLNNAEEAAGQVMAKVVMALLTISGLLILVGVLNPLFANVLGYS